MKCFVKEKKLRCYLIRKNSTYVEFADKLGISRQHLSALLSGRIGVSAAIRTKLLSVVDDLSFDDIFTIKEK